MVLVSWLANSDSWGHSLVSWDPRGVVWPGLPTSRPLVPCTAPEESRQSIGLGHSFSSELGWLCGPSEWKLGHKWPQVEAELE